MAKKIKLLVITHSYPTKVHPTSGIFIKNQYDYMKDHCDVKIIFPYPYIPKFKKLNPYYKFSEIPFKEEVGGIEVYHPKYLFFPRNGIFSNFLSVFLFFESFFSYLSSKNLIYKLKKEWDFDIIKVHGCIAESVTGVMSKKKYKKPLLVMLHGEDVTRFSKIWFLKILARPILKNSDAIICKSNSLKKEVLEMGIVNKAIYIIPSGYAVKRFKPKSSVKCRKMLNLPINKKIILFAGDLIPRKGVEYLIRAMKLVVKSNGDIWCYIVGDGILKSELRNLADKLNLNKCVFFVGEKKLDEMPLWMNACDILVLPSLNESLPSVLSEAMACGKPVVATNVAGAPEIVNKDVGYLVKPKNADDLAEKIILALNKKWKREKLFKRAKEFSVTNSVKKTLKLYDKLLDFKEI